MIRPKLPSWIRSRKSIPRPTYLFAMLTTRRRFASARRFLAASSPFSILFASSISSSAERSGTLPISFRYIRTGSSMLTPSGTERSILSSSISSSSSLSMSASSSSRIISSALLSVILSTSTPLASRKSNTFSICSTPSGWSLKKSLISWYSSTFFFFLASSRSSTSFSLNLPIFISICALYLHIVFIFYPYSKEICNCCRFLRRSSRSFLAFTSSCRPFISAGSNVLFFSFRLSSLIRSTASEKALFCSSGVSR